MKFKIGDEFILDHKQNIRSMRDFLEKKGHSENSVLKIVDIVNNGVYGMNYVIAIGEIILSNHWTDGELTHFGLKLINRKKLTLKDMMCKIK